MERSLFVRELRLRQSEAAVHLLLCWPESAKTNLHDGHDVGKPLQLIECCRSLQQRRGACDALPSPGRLEAQLTTLVPAPADESALHLAVHVAGVSEI